MTVPPGQPQQGLTDAELDALASGSGQGGGLTDEQLDAMAASKQPQEVTGFSGPDRLISKSPTATAIIKPVAKAVRGAAGTATNPMETLTGAAGAAAGFSGRALYAPEGIALFQAKSSLDPLRQKYPNEVPASELTKLVDESGYDPSTDIDTGMGGSANAFQANKTQALLSTLNQWTKTNQRQSIPWKEVDTVLKAQERLTNDRLHGHFESELPNYIADEVASQKADALKGINDRLQNYKDNGAKIFQQMAEEEMGKLLPSGSTVMTPDQSKAALKHVEQLLSSPNAQIRAQAQQAMQQASDVQVKAMEAAKQRYEQAVQSDLSQVPGLIKDYQDFSQHGTAPQQKLYQDVMNSPEGTFGQLGYQAAQLLATLGTSTSASLLQSGKLLKLAGLMQIPNAIEAGQQVATGDLPVSDFIKEQAKGVLFNRLLMSPALKKLTDFKMAGGKALGAVARSGAISTAMAAGDQAIGGGSEDTTFAEDIGKNLPLTLAFEGGHAIGEARAERALKPNIDAMTSTYPDAKTAQRRLVQERQLLAAEGNDLSQRIKAVSDDASPASQAMRDRLSEIQQQFVQNDKNLQAVQLLQGRKAAWSGDKGAFSEPELQQMAKSGVEPGLQPAPEDLPKQQQPQPPAPVIGKAEAKEPATPGSTEVKSEQKIAKTAGLPEPVVPRGTTQPSFEQLVSQAANKPVAKTSEVEQPPEQPAEQPSKEQLRAMADDLLAGGHEPEDQAALFSQAPGSEDFERQIREAAGAKGVAREAGPSVGPSSPESAELGKEPGPFDWRGKMGYFWQARDYLRDQLSRVRSGIQSSVNIGKLPDVERFSGALEQAAKADFMTEDQKVQLAHLASAMTNALQNGGKVPTEAWDQFGKMTQGLREAAKTKDSAAVERLINGSKNLHEMALERAGFTVSNPGDLVNRSTLSLPQSAILAHRAIWEERQSLADQMSQLKDRTAARKESGIDTSALESRANEVRAKLDQFNKLVSSDGELNVKAFKDFVSKNPGVNLGGDAWHMNSRGIPAPVPTGERVAEHVPIRATEAQALEAAQQSVLQESKAGNPEADALLKDGRLDPTAWKNYIRMHADEHGVAQTPYGVYRLAGGAPVPMKPSEVEAGVQFKAAPPSDLGAGSGESMYTKSVYHPDEYISWLNERLRQVAEPGVKVGKVGKFYEPPKVERGRVVPESLPMKEGVQPSPEKRGPTFQEQMKLMKEGIRTQRESGVNEKMRTPEEMTRFEQQGRNLRLNLSAEDMLSRAAEKGIHVYDPDLQDERGHTVDHPADTYFIPRGTAEKAVHARELAGERPIGTELGGYQGTRRLTAAELAQNPEARGAGGFSAGLDVEKGHRTDEDIQVAGQRLEAERQQLKESRREGGLAERGARNEIARELYRRHVLNDEDINWPPDVRSNLSSLLEREAEHRMDNLGQDARTAITGARDAMAVERNMAIKNDPLLQLAQKDAKARKIDTSKLPTEFTRNGSQLLDELGRKPLDDFMRMHGDRFSDADKQAIADVKRQMEETPMRSVADAPQRLLKGTPELLDLYEKHLSNSLADRLGHGDLKVPYSKEEQALLDRLKYTNTPIGSDLPLGGDPSRKIDTVMMTPEEQASFLNPSSPGHSDNVDKFYELSGAPSGETPEDEGGKPTPELAISQPSHDQFTSEELAERMPETFKSFAQHLAEGASRRGEPMTPEKLTAQVLKEARSIWSDNGTHISEGLEQGSLREARLASWKALGRTSDVTSYYNALSDIQKTMNTTVVQNEAGEYGKSMSRGLISEFYGNLDPMLVRGFKVEGAPSDSGRGAAEFDLATRTARIFYSWKDWLNQVRRVDMSAPTDIASKVATNMSVQNLLHETAHFLEAATGQPYRQMVVDGWRQEREALGQKKPWYKALFLDTPNPNMQPIGDRFRVSGAGDSSTRLEPNGEGYALSQHFAEQIRAHQAELEKDGFTVTTSRVSGAPEVFQGNLPIFKSVVGHDGKPLYQVTHPVEDYYAFRDPSEFFAETASRYLTQAASRQYDPSKLTTSRNLSVGLYGMMNQIGGVLRALNDSDQTRIDQSKVAALLADAIGSGRAVSADQYLKNVRMAERDRAGRPLLNLVTDTRLKKQPVDSYSVGAQPEDAPDSLKAPAPLVDRTSQAIKDAFKDAFEWSEKKALEARAFASATAEGIKDRARSAQVAAADAGAPPVIGVGARSFDTLFSTDEMTDASKSQARMIEPVMAQVKGAYDADKIFVERKAGLYSHLNKQVSEDQSTHSLAKVMDAVHALPDEIVKKHLDAFSPQGASETDPDRKVAVRKPLEVSIDTKQGKMPYHVMLNDDGSLMKAVSERQMQALDYIESNGAIKGNFIDPITESKLRLGMDYIKQANDGRWDNLLRTDGVNQEAIQKLKTSTPMYLMHSYAYPGSINGTDYLLQDMTGGVNSPISNKEAGRLEQRQFPTYRDALKSGYLPRIDNAADTMLQGGLQLDNLRLFRQLVSNMQTAGHALYTTPENIKDPSLWAEVKTGAHTGSEHALGFDVEKAMLRPEQWSMLKAAREQGLKPEEAGVDKPKLYVRRDLEPMMGSIFGQGLRGIDLYRKITALNGILIPLRLMGFFHPGMVANLAQASTLSGMANTYQVAREFGKSHGEALEQAGRAFATNPTAYQLHQNGGELKDALIQHGFKSPAEIMSLNIPENLKAMLLMSQAGNYNVMDNPLRDSRGRYKLEAALANLGYGDVRSLKDLVAKPLGGLGAVAGRAAETAEEWVQRKIMTQTVAPIKLGWARAEMEQWLKARYGADPQMGRKVYEDLQRGEKSLDGTQARQIFDRADDVFGLLNYQRLWMDPKARDTMVGLEQAYGWHLGNNRLLLKSFGDAKNLVKPGEEGPSRALNHIAGQAAWASIVGMTMAALGISHLRKDNNPAHALQDILFPLMKTSKGNVRLGTGYLPDYAMAVQHTNRWLQKEVIGGKSPVVDLFLKSVTGKSNWGAGIFDDQSKSYPIGNPKYLPGVGKDDAKAMEQQLQAWEKSPSALDRARAGLARRVIEVADSSLPYSARNYKKSEARKDPLLIRTMLQGGYRELPEDMER